MTRKTAKAGGAITTYEFDTENKLVRVVSPSNTANYRYDGLGRRVEKEVIAGSTTTTRYVYDNEDILLELNGANAIVARYTHGPGIDEPLITEKNSQSFYYHADGLGSITELTNQSGTVVQQYTYSSFGKIESQLDPNFLQPFNYTSREFDSETGLYYYRARNYETSNGRFLQEDPISILVYTAPHDNHLYVYVANNPTNRSDPSGAVILPAVAIGAGIGAVTSIYGALAVNPDATWGTLALAGLTGAVAGGVAGAVDAGVLLGGAVGAVGDVIGQVATGNVHSLSDIDVNSVITGAMGGALGGAGGQALQQLGGSAAASAGIAGSIASVVELLIRSHDAKRQRGMIPYEEYKKGNYPGGSYCPLPR